MLPTSPSRPLLLPAAFLALLVTGHGLAAQEPQAPTPAPAEDTGALLPLGVDLDFLTPRDPSLAFWDAFQTSSPWFPYDGRADVGLRKRELRELAKRRPETDEHGWPLLSPGERVCTRMFETMEGRYPEGTYTCTWRGKGRISFTGDARAAGEPKATADGHTLAVTVHPGRMGVVLVVEESDRKDPVRDIHLWMPGYEKAKSPFYSSFLERIAPFGVIRFVSWQRIYTNDGVWSHRPLPTDARQTGPRGVAVEVMVDLCNQTGADPWFCMPHLADDEYVRSFAELVKERLRPEAKVYVEYSNELWNGIFPQARWASSEAQKRGIRVPELVAEETARDFRIWRDVLGDRVVRVASGQLHNPGFTRVLVQSLQGELDAIAVAPYFGPRIPASKDGLDGRSTAQEIMDVSLRNLREVILPRLRDVAAMRDKLSSRLGRPIRLITYEGGQTVVARSSLAPGDARLSLNPATVEACQYSDAMATGYRELLDGCREAGYDLFLATNLCGGYNPASTFGLLEWIDQPVEQSVKYRAVLQPWRKASASKEPADGPAKKGG